VSCTEKVYIENANDLKDRITRIEAIITALETQLTTGAANSDIVSYSLDDGQTKITSQYRGVASMMAGLKALDTLRQRLINQLNGRVKAIRPWQGLRS
jgi:hypothetical protein